MMKILLATLDWPQLFGEGGGIGNYYSQLRSLAPADIQIDVLNPVADGQGIIKKNFYQSYIWPHWTLLFFELKKLLFKNEYNYYWAGQIWPVGLVLYLLSLYFPKKCQYFISLHGLDIQIIKKNKLKAFIGKQILRRAKLITVNSHYTEKLTRALAPEKKYLVVYPSANDLKPASDTNKQSLVNQYNLKGKKIILSVSRLVKRKGQDLIIKTLNDLWLNFPELIYVCVGQGPELPKLKLLAEQTSHPNQIIFIDQADNEQLAAWYQIADLFVLPVHKNQNDPEGFGMVYLEANQFGLPVIGSKTGGIPEAISDQQSGLLVNPDDEADLTKTIVKFFTNESLRQTLKTESMLWAKKFSWSQSGLTLFTAIKKL